MSNCLLIAGTASRGMAGDARAFVFTDDSVSHVYGEVRREEVYLTPTGSSLSLVGHVAEATVRFVFWDGTRYIGIPLHDQSVTGTASGSLVTFASPPLTGATSGWALYRAEHGPDDLCQAWRVAREQHSRTPVLDNRIHLVRISAEGESAPTLTLNQLVFTGLYPGHDLRDWRFQITSGTTGALTIVPPPEENLKTALRYMLSGSALSFFRTIQADIENGLVPFALSLSTGDMYTVSGTVSGLVTGVGIYSPTGGSTGTVTPADYDRVFSRLDLGEYEVIGMPGRQGREVYGYASEWMDTDNVDTPGFPFRLVASTTGADIASCFNDLWVGQRLMVVGATGLAGFPYRRSTDLVASYAVILASARGLTGLGTASPLAVEIATETIPGRDVLNALAATGVVWPGRNLLGPTIWKGTSTRVDTMESVAGVLRSVFRRVLPLLQAQIGIPAPQALSRVEPGVQSALTQSQAESPIREWAAQVSRVDDRLTVVMDLQVAGTLETITCAVAQRLT